MSKSKAKVNEPKPEKSDKIKHEFRGMKGKHGKRSQTFLERDETTLTISFTRHNKDGTETQVVVTAVKIGKKKP